MCENTIELIHMIHFEIPKNQSSIIKVIGVGGGGSNAVNYMYNLGIQGVDFIVCNTDQQALEQSSIPNKIQLGPNLTQGLGAGANPDIGMQAGVESIEDITKLLEVNTKMAFVTAGMGGGTGTGAAPIISEVCKSLNILTVGIVTTPFFYEGNKRLRQAKEGIERMKQNVDTILIISNDKLRQQYGNLPFNQAFAKADNILATAAKCITDLITVDGKVNLDFNDVQTVMKNGGVAILGSARAAGETRATIAVEEALNSPLLNDNEIKGAKWILLNITSAPGDYEHTLDELEIIQGYVQAQAGNNCDIILGMGNDPALNDEIAVTIIATGFEHHDVAPNLDKTTNAATPDKEVFTLNSNRPQSGTPSASIKEEDPLAPRLVDNSAHNNSPSALINEPEMPTNSGTPFQVNIPKPENIKVNPQGTSYYNSTSNANTFELFIREDGHNNNQTSNNQPQNSFNQSPYEPAPAVAPQPVHQPVNTLTMTERYMTDAEIEESRRFEDQKRIFEERAARLRQMSHTLRSDMNDIENIPAYQRRNEAQIEEQFNSQNDTQVSGYRITPNEPNNNTNINTINTFLEGNKPD